MDDIRYCANSHTSQLLTGTDWLCTVHAMLSDNDGDEKGNWFFLIQSLFPASISRDRWGTWMDIAQDGEILVFRVSGIFSRAVCDDMTMLGSRLML